METRLDRPNELVQDQDHAACSLDASHVLTWEEIANLAAEAGKPAETLMNVVALIARRFRHRRLLGLSAGAGPRQSGAGRDARAAPGMRRHAAHGGARRARPAWSPSRFVRWPSSRCKNHPRFKYFSDAGEDTYHSFLGVPLIDRGVLQGVLVVQTVGGARLSGRRDSTC